MAISAHLSVRQSPVGQTRRDFLRLSGLTIAAIGGSWSLTGCGLFGADSKAPDGQSTLKIDYVPVEVLDPQVITNGMWILSRGISEGLVAQNENGDGVQPAVASEWKVSDDHLTYTFTLRGNAQWSDGKPVVAQDFERTYKRLFTPAGGSAGGTTLGANSYQTATGIKGAQDFLSGVLTDWTKVGVHANGDHELVLTLAHPNPDFLLALTHPAMLPLPMDLVESKPKDWQNPPNYVSNGPYTVTEWVANSRLILVPNEKYWDRGNVKVGRIQVNLVEPSAAATATVPYENGETDLVQLAGPDVLRFQKSATLSKELEQTENYSILYLAKLRSQHKAMDDVRVRKALSLALDRKTLAGVQPGQQPGVSLVTSRAKGWDDSIAIKEDVGEAKQLLAQAGYPNGQGLPPVRLLVGVPDTTLADAIVDSWTKQLGIKAVVDHVEAGVYTERRWQVQKGDYIGFYYGTFAGLPTWPTMVGSLWSPQNVQEISLPSDQWQKYQAVQDDKTMTPAAKTAQLKAIRTGYAAKPALEIGTLVEQAAAESDDAKRLALYKQAAKLREEQYLYLPVLWQSLFHAVKPKVHGLQLRAYPDYFYLKPLSVVS
ncbi:peptide/nickel transport system substrate-binding protein/oligopeptide transport system substrate-binding protein [Kribbella aluminosa]|uniref:Peptide/nickel transport system substrate-binding protein/oligopeptide transport system substrate-binding protein n=1 Tax=Kribbella aluminosa TaxID=416017 RepID=A0ABS4USC8_9ACTN|nr:peptide ABC transporter substrate-binding protein [Kribbella aluminosa]MBP2354526.1 peptide/nickel transport system substrate-binding protein/oligopeptide transport system substrate-binding protein [Kribbella aluminosa]